jgi:hypothetical protein
LDIFGSEGCKQMVTREKIAAEIENVPDDRLDELYRIIKDLEPRRDNDGSDLSTMARLRRIRINAPPDFSTRAINL